MKMDELFKNAKRLNPPDTLWQKVEKEIVEQAQENNEDRFMKWLPKRAGYRKPAWAAIAMAAALILAIRLAPAPEVLLEPAQKDDTTEINEFIDETLGSVFSFDSEFDGHKIDNSDNVGLPLLEGLDNILWINGGENA